MSNKKINNLFVKSKRITAIALLSAMPLSTVDCFAQMVPVPYIPQSSSRHIDWNKKKENKKKNEKTQTCKMDTCVVPSDQAEYATNDTLQSHVTEHKHSDDGMKDALKEAFIMYGSIVAGLGILTLAKKQK